MLFRSAPRGELHTVRSSDLRTLDKQHSAFGMPEI
jgi:hypothetical protein